MGAAGDGHSGHGHARGWAEVPIAGLTHDADADVGSAWLGLFVWDVLAPSTEVALLGAYITPNAGVCVPWRGREPGVGQGAFFSA